MDDPIVVLGGGPGGGGIVAALKVWAPEAIPLWRASRYVILFDQRGTGKSKPNLNCPESDAALVASFKESVGARCCRLFLLFFSFSFCALSA